MSFAAPAQEVTIVCVPHYGPEPIGARQSTRIQNDSIRNITGQSKPNLDARGVTGDPSRTFSGDLGPIQGDFTMVRSVAAPNSYRAGESTALPSTSGGGTIQDSLGQLGI